MKKILLKSIEQLGYKYGYDTVFNDLLTASINYFLIPDTPCLDLNVFDSYDKSDRLTISSMIIQLINTYHEDLTTKSWTDPLGEIYEEISSKAKNQMLGQFFTPPSLCDLMAQITKPQQSSPIPATLNDPSCGSGRTILSYAAIQPKIKAYAQDIDIICAKMCAINFMIHGIQGEVICHDSLKLDDYRMGFRINRLLPTNGLPSIELIERTASIYMQQVDAGLQPEPSFQQLNLF